MLGSDHDRPHSVSSSGSSPFLALGSGGRPIGSLLNPYDAAVVDASARQRPTCSSHHASSTTSTPSLHSSTCCTDGTRSGRSTPSTGRRTSLSGRRTSLSGRRTSHSGRRHSFPGRRDSLRSQQQQQRESCLAYEEEEVCFIWYHRVDLQKEWADVRRAFNAQFPTRQRSGFQGIQCRYYRYLYHTWKVPKIRVQKRLGRNVGAAGENARKYGLRQWTKREYSWMMEGEGAV